MDARWSPMNQDSARAAQVIRHPTATFAQLIAGTATDGVDLSAYASKIKHTSKDAEVTFNYHHALDGTAQPAPGELLELRLNGQMLWVGIIDTISAYAMKSGEHSLTVKAYTRDNTPTWKDLKRVTTIYSTGTPIGVIADDIAAAIGLGASEIVLPAFGVYTVHSNMQLANLSAFEMLKTLLLSSGYEPGVDAYGRLRAISRDLARPSDVVLPDARILSIDGSKARSPVTSVRVLWLDPNLAKVSQQSQSLANETITAGFFQIKQTVDVYYSQDRTQRAENTFLVVKQSANSGLLHFCTESYSQVSPTSGRIDVDTSVFAPALATAALASLLAAHFIPDDVAAFGAGVTIPVGRLVEGASQVAILLVMMSLGTGVYEVWGEPFDYVHARNTSEATALGVPDWMLNNSDIETDFVMNEAHAQAFAARELIYQARAASAYRATIVDDPRIERGDIVELSDGSRIYVTEYSRDLTIGTPAELEISGFRA